jgi:EAL domain-containing protein (putative c-di-GMP-specific phosphodiesterase class I)/GGDEF domain-containing protein
MPLSHIETAFDRNELCQKIAPHLNYDDTLNSALILINVWHTRQISAHHGYDISQEILALIAKELGTYVKENCCLLRTANHEFALLIQNIKNPGHCQLALNKIIRDLNNKPLTLSNYSTKTKMTVGAALYPTHAVSAENLVQCVEIAVNQAEEKNASSVMYSKVMSERIVKQIRIETELDLAIKAQELELWYQPKINIQTGAIYGVEALTRWKTKTDGFISPDIFIPLAEQRGFIFDMTRWVLNTAFRAQKEWAAMGLDINMAVNISGKVIDDDEFVNLIEHTRGLWESLPESITLEVTETAMMQSMEESLDKLNTLRGHGFILSIDDFGTGYSSLEYFKTLPVHEVKIDKSFVQHMMTSEDDNNLVQMIVGLAKNFSLKMVAEGVEEGDACQELKKLGVHRVQGYYFSKPLPEDEFLTWAEYYITNENSHIVQ